MKTLIKEINVRFHNKRKFLWKYIISAICGSLNRSKYKEIQDLCLFIGYGRSGHTLVASLLDAHPDIIIGIEWGLLSYIKLGFNKNQVIYSLLKRSQNYTKILNNVWTGYSYKVKESWQGRYRNLKVIGDKFGEVNAGKLMADPNIIKLTEKKFGLKPKIIHVVRNPFDMITTKTIRRFEMDNIKEKPQTIDMLPFIRKIFANADVIMCLKEENRYSLIDVYHEDLIGNPKQALSNLIKFLEVELDEKYIENCISILYNIPHKSRSLIQWPEELISYVEKECKKYPFFSHYRYQEGE